MTVCTYFFIHVCMYFLCMYVCMYGYIQRCAGEGRRQPPPSSSRDVTTIDRRCCSRAQFAVARSRWAWSSPSRNLVVCGRVAFFFLGGFLSLLSKEGGRRRSGNNPISEPIAVSLGVAQLLLLNVDSRKNAEILAFFTPKVSI